eukprot:TRINITY_DN97517_c0_g1_i1.p1 TRINITY_DN97517_c0_g1~~TRINITY_DN97517_c0_g1_i1.p1  ORF type:complete len:372 (+),score=99.11 TRINITY_DN97517_c0_g1_i1:45-1160(+)
MQRLLRHGVAVSSACLPKHFSSKAAPGVVELLAQSGELAKAGGRAALRQHRSEVEELYRQVSKVGAEAVLAGSSFSELSDLLRVLSCSGFPPQTELVEAALKQLQKAQSSSSADVDADAAAQIALALHEAGLGQGTEAPGSKAVTAIAAAGWAASSSRPAGPQLGGRGAAALALAVSAGDCSPQLLEALVKRSSAREMDLDVAALGDLRLAALMAGEGVLDAMDSHALSFLRTMCDEVLLDDPRGFPPAASDYVESLTPVERDLSEALTACEVPHCRGTLLAGAFFPLTSFALKAAICVEESATGAAYAVGPAANHRSCWQTWKYRAAAATGWRIFAVPEADWHDLTGSDAKTAYIRRLLQAPPLDVTELR